MEPNRTDRPAVPPTSPPSPPQGARPPRPTGPPQKTTPPPAKKTQPSRFKLVASVAGVVAIITVAVILMVVFLPKLFGGKGAPYVTKSYAIYLQSDGSAEVVNKKGEQQKIDVKAAQIKGDRNASFFVYTDGDDMLYSYNGKTGEKAQLADDVRDLGDIYLDRFVLFSRSDDKQGVDDVLKALALKDSDDDGLKAEIMLNAIVSAFNEKYPDATLQDALQFYTDMTGEEYVIETSYYLYDLATENETRIFDAAAADGRYTFNFMPSANDKQLAYLNDQGDIILLDETGDEQTISSADANGHFTLQAVPDSGALVIWRQSNAEDGRYSLYGKVGKKEEKLYSGGYDGYLGNAIVEYSAQDKSALLAPVQADLMLEVDAEKGAEEIRVDGSPIVAVARPNESWKRYDASLGLFVVTSEDGETGTLYFLDSKKNREKISDDVKTEFGHTAIQAGGKAIFYQDSDNNLKSSKVSGSKAGKSEKIASDVAGFTVSTDAKNVWYLKGEAYERSLHLYKDGESQKIADKCDYLIPSSDGNAVLFLQNPAPLDEQEEIDMGELCLWQDEAISSLGKDVAFPTVETLRQDGYLEPSQFFFLANCTAKDGDIVGDLYLFNGEKTEQIASKVR